MDGSSCMTPESIGDAIQAHLKERESYLLPSGEETREGRRFSWCGEILEFLSEGVTERLAAMGITLTNSFPGPFRLLDEEQQPDGQHVRRFWTIASRQGCPIARLCTYFFHRHDQIKLPQLPQVVAYAPDAPGREEVE